MAVCLTVARVALSCAALVVAFMVSPAEARDRHSHHSPQHHYRHNHYHRAYHHAAAAQDVQQPEGSSSWNQQGAWNGNWGQSDDHWQQAQSQGWGNPQGTWGGSAGWSQQARAEHSDAAGRAVGAPEAGGGLKDLVARHARENGIPVALADAVVRIESGYNPRARNRSGAMGLMQIKAQTARGQGFSGSASALLNPETNLHYAMRYLATAYRMSGGDVCGTVMRYQSGHYARHMSGADRSYCSRARHLMARA